MRCQHGDHRHHFLAGVDVGDEEIHAVIGNGEGATCRPVNTDLSNWLNWDPQPGEGYHRTLNYNITPFVPAHSTPAHYPH
jgi:hypothetical protein